MCCSLPFADCPTYHADPFVFADGAQLPEPEPPTLDAMIAYDIAVIAYYRLRERFGSPKRDQTGFQKRGRARHLALSKGGEKTMPKTNSTNYTQGEARQLVGQTFQSLIEFSGVPKGTNGKVAAIDQMGDGYDLVIEWDLGPSAIRPNGQGMRDWFTREEMERFMRPVTAAVNI